ncbi:Uu.00g016900.m01.CDS01 [Anthostomella pinea]|uniref:Uu.00g016900.m01.CDS01 n=1 Tax=Anthostomella pinea TaxID=933095 RepID=A0AAI8VT03_9PEZI|nr:Uu.00g016900.m01.CDS01 [Anthostomella pinea]
MNMSTTAAEGQHGPGNLAILTKVDKLRELIGTRVALPQLVVVGDQSSGKSSVLEGLTGFAFPRDAELCTRYATQITCRREVEESITVSIMPNLDAPPQEQQRVKAFQRTLTEMSPGNLANLFKEANEAMGIRTSTNITSLNGSSLPAFSEHVLKIEKLGPNEEHFTVIDVPGIFRNETDGMTTESDIDLVMNMVKKYMQDSRTIILAIMPSNVDPATQEILKLAKRADPTMTRTMAVLTKPDLAIERATQQIAIDHVAGKRSDLTLGYYIVKNRGPDDANKSLEQGQTEERMFFAKTPWSVLNSTGKAGMDALKLRVRELLIDLIKKEFPKLKAEIVRELAVVRAQCDKMGPARSNPHAQRAYLNKMSEAFQTLARSALTADYTGDEIFSEHHNLRLVTRIVEANEEFSDKMADDGHTRPFATKPYTVDSPGEGSYSSDDDRIVRKSSDFLNRPDWLFDQFYPELSEIVGWRKPTKPDADSDVDIMDYIEEVYLSSRGQDLGTFGGALLGTMFKEQSKKWESLTLSHMSRAIYHVHDFIYSMIEEICPDNKVREALWDDYLVEELQEAYRHAMTHAKFLLEIEREGTPLTLNHYFNDNIQKSQVDRLMAAIEKLGTVSAQAGNAELGVFLSRSQLGSLSANKANSEHVREYMHDILKSYYKVSRKRFVDVVCQQAVNYFLLSGKNSPLKIFSTEMVLGLNEEQLDMIAAEDETVKLGREKLLRDIENFEAALKVLKGSG